MRAEVLAREIYARVLATEGNSHFNQLTPLCSTEHGLEELAEMCIKAARAFEQEWKRHIEPEVKP